MIYSVGHVVLASETSLHQVWFFAEVQQHSSVFMLGFWRLLQQLSLERGVELALEWFNSSLDSSISASETMQTYDHLHECRIGSFAKGKIFEQHKHGGIFTFCGKSS
jgi:hypothetical protein